MKFGDQTDYKLHDVRCYDYCTSSESVSDDWKYDIVSSMQDLFEEILLHTEDQPDLLSSVQDDKALFLWALDLLAHSPMGLGLIRRAIENDWNIKVADLGTGGFHLDIPQKELTLDHYGLTADSLARSSFYRYEFVLNLVRGLRDIWQEARFGALERDMRPEAVLILERVRAADADTITVATIWELRCAGFNDIWRHLLGGDLSDLAAAYADKQQHKASVSSNKKAMADIFQLWFFNDARVKLVDHETLDTLDMVLEWAQEQTERFNPFGEKFLSAKTVTALSCLPDKCAYLAPTAKRICADPEFMTINDPINEAHLFQIVYDMDVVLVDHVPFRDGALARKIFPDGKIQRV